MRRYGLAALFIVALVSMLCIGFVAGAVVTTTVSRASQLSRLFNNNDQREFRAAPELIPGDQLPDLGRTAAGVVIMQVANDGPAAEAGIQSGDVLVSVDGTPITSREDLTNVLADHEPGDTVSIEVTGPDGDTRTVDVELGDNPDQAGAAYLGIRVGMAAMQNPFEGQMPQMPGNGMPQIPELPQDQIPSIPGLEHPGALIREVTPDSPAEAAGLQAGQLIQAVDGKEVAGANNLSDIIAGYQPGDEVTLTVYDISNGLGQGLSEPKEVTVELGENPDREGAPWLGIRYITIELNGEPESSPGG